MRCLNDLIDRQKKPQVKLKFSSWLGVNPNLKSINCQEIDSRDLINLEPETSPTLKGDRRSITIFVGVETEIGRTKNQDIIG